MNKIKSVTALKYEGSGAPVLVAKGKGYIATKIIDLARSEGVIIHQDPGLENYLQLQELGSEIPVELYGAVAEVFSYLYSIDKDLTSSQVQ